MYPLLPQSEILALLLTVSNVIIFTTSVVLRFHSWHVAQWFWSVNVPFVRSLEKHEHFLDLKSIIDMAAAAYEPDLQPNSKCFWMQHNHIFVSKNSPFRRKKLEAKHSFPLSIREVPLCRPHTIVWTSLTDFNSLSVYLNFRKMISFDNIYDQ